MGSLSSKAGAAFLAAGMALHGGPSAAGGWSPPQSWITETADGRILGGKDIDKPRYPASLAKLMTLYLLFHALKTDAIQLDTPMPVSAHAASMPRTNLGLKPGQTITPLQAILSIIVHSANDAAVVVAEKLSEDGSEEKFAERMTQQARDLGMEHTVFSNASGLPDPSMTMMTTPRDMARLAIRLWSDFPQEYSYFSTQNFTLEDEDGADRQFKTHNHFTGKYPCGDGLKTGFTYKSGFNLAASSTRDLSASGRECASKDGNNGRLFTVVFGEHSPMNAVYKTFRLHDQGWAMYTKGQQPEHALALGSGAP